MRTTNLCLALTVALVFSVAVAQAAPPQPDFTNLPAYIRALQASHDPQAVAIRRQIADGPAALARERAAAQAAGIPLTLPPLPPPPADQNAAVLYEKWDALRKEKPMRLPRYTALNWPMGSRYAYTPAQITEMEQLVQSRPDLFDLLHRATDAPAFVFSQDPSQNFPIFATVREAAREIKTESFLLAKQGRYTEAVTDQARGFKIAKQITAHPDLIEYLVGDAVEAITLSGMQDILYLAGPNADVDTLVQQAIRAAQPVMSLKQALVGEVAVSLSYTEKLRDGTPADFASLVVGGTTNVPDLPKTFIPSERQFVNNLVDADEADYLAQMRRLIAAADEPSPARRAVFAAVTADMAGQSPVRQMNPLTRLMALLAPVFGPLDNIEARRQAQEQVMMAGAAVLVEKARTGAFPALLPSGFLDPYSGRSLGYRREGDTGFVVYSVGPDGTFSGGRPGQDPFTVTIPPRNQVFFRYPGPTPKTMPADVVK